MTEYEHALAKQLVEFLTPQRRQRFASVLNWRTRWITVAVADIYQQHNASAVLRTCDAFGIQDVHIVETFNEFETNPEIALGTDQWLTLHRHSGSEAILSCINRLKERDYRIVATIPRAESRPIREFTIEQPVALFFGTEKDGLPEEAIAEADELVHLPMYGFVESFNVSVAAALCLQELTSRLHASSQSWQLTADEQSQLLLDWARKSITGVDGIERRFLVNWQTLHRSPDSAG